LIEMIGWFSNYFGRRRGRIDFLGLGPSVNSALSTTSESLGFWLPVDGHRQGRSFNRSGNQAPQCAEAPSHRLGLGRVGASIAGRLTLMRRQIFLAAVQLAFMQDRAR
jgi:hypothetical protein